MNYALQIAKERKNINLIGFCRKFLDLYHDILRKIELDQISKLTVAPSVATRPALAPTNTSANTKGFEANLPAQPALYFPMAIEPVTTTVDVIGEANIIAKKRPQQVNPSVTARDFIAKVPIKIYREAYYIFIGGYYQLLEEVKVKRILNHFYREEAERFRFAQFYDEVLEFVQCEYDLVVTNDGFEETKYLISFRNGILDTTTMRFHSANPNYFLTTCIAEDYHPQKQDCPNFDQFIFILSNGDPALIARIYETIGLIVSNDPDAKSIFCAQGVTNSGKSTLIKFIASLFPEEQVTAVAINGLDRSFALKEFIGKSLCTDTELSPDPLKTPWVAKLKQLSSSDPLSTDVKFKDYATFVYRGKIFLATNHRFLLSTPDNAFMKRIVALPFVVEIPKQQMNTNILKIFASERPAIINKAVYHYCRLRTNNYIFSGNFEINQMFDECQTTQAPLITKNDIVEKFISSKLEVTGNTDDYLFTKDIYSMCQHFCSIHRFPNIEQKELTSSIKIALGCTIQSSKKRAPGCPNPLNALLGLKAKNIIERGVPYEQ